MGFSFVADLVILNQLYFDFEAFCFSNTTHSAS